MMKPSTLKVVKATFCVFGACCANVLFLESITKESPSAIGFVSFAQFLFIALEGFIFTSKCGTAPLHVPLRNYIILVSMFFATSVSNNYALGYGISMPLHMIFKSGSLIANLVLGIVILKRTYSLSKHISVILVTIGIIICTFVSMPDSKLKENEQSQKDEPNVVSWFIGVSLLTFSLFLSARTGIYQETLYSRFGKHTKEALYYCHMLPLPGFLLFWRDICENISKFNNSEPVMIPFLLMEIGVPKLWLFLIANVATQYICINSVFTLTTECTSLTVTLIITLRKFVSLILSVLYFKNPFTIWHSLGAFLVFVGSLLFAEVPMKLYNYNKKLV